jgi:branched-chain amino acid transport system ATP-binding protein
MSEPLLVVEEAVAHYGRSLALDGVSLTVGEGEAVALLGPNGAGKSTVALAVGGLVRLTSGRVTFAGQDITRAPAHRIASSGLLQVPEGRGVLRDLSVRENLRLGLIAARGRNAGSLAAALERALELFPRLADKLERIAGSLSGGEQQMVVLARAVIGRPRLLILDEPSLGLAPHVVADTFRLLGRLVDDGLSILVVEQNLAMSLRLATRGYVLSNGRPALAGSAEELRNEDRLRDAYLGGDVARTAAR